MGSNPKRDDACLGCCKIDFFNENNNVDPINVGIADHLIKQLARKVSKIVGYNGKIFGINLNLME